MSDEVSEVRRRIEASQELPHGRCTRCSGRTGQVAPHYARVETHGVVIRMPFCESCIEQYLEEARQQVPGFCDAWSKRYLEETPARKRS